MGNRGLSRSVERLSAETPAAILLSNDVEGFSSSRETFADCARAFPVC